jgi:hypothetical protein
MDIKQYSAPMYGKRKARGQECAHLCQQSLDRPVHRIVLMLQVTENWVPSNSVAICFYVCLKAQLPFSITRTSGNSFALWSTEELLLAAQGGTTEDQLSHFTVLLLH